MNKQLIFLGAPGSGKGTQANLLATELGYKHISTGDLLREEISKESELGAKVKSVLDAGELVQDELVLELLKANCKVESSKYIFDGFPRNIDQARSLDETVLGGFPYQAIFFDLDTNLLVNRLTNRRTCGDCKAIYNLVTSPPKKEGVCDNCGSKNLIQREDDQENIIRNRLDVYISTISPVLEYYKNKKVLTTVNATDEIDKVYKEIVAAISA